MPRKVFTLEEQATASLRYRWDPEDYWVNTFLSATLDEYHVAVSRSLVVQVYRELIVASTFRSESFIVQRRIYELFLEEQSPPSFEPGDDTEEAL